MLLSRKDLKFLWFSFIVFCYRICTGLEYPNTLEWNATMNLRDLHNQEDVTRELPAVGRENLNDYMVGTGDDYIRLAKELVRTYYDTKWSFQTGGKELPAYEVYIVWFSKTLDNWKALAGTTRPDNMYFELTHNGAKKETYLDVYRKMDNVAIPDLKNGTYT